MTDSQPTSNIMANDSEILPGFYFFNEMSHENYPLGVKKTKRKYREEKIQVAAAVAARSRYCFLESGKLRKLDLSTGILRCL